MTLSKHRGTAILLALMLCLPLLAAGPAKEKAGIRVGAAAAEIIGDDSMDVEGSIFPRHVKGQEGQLRASAVVISEGRVRLCIVSCDVLLLMRETDDAAAKEIEKQTGIPAQNVLITATHTHSTPATGAAHMTQADLVFTQRVHDAIVKAATQASKNLKASRLYFALGNEATVGHNSRQLLSDGTIWWTGPSDDAVRPTGPFDCDLPVIAFKDPGGKLEALMFNHSSHNIGSLEPKRSPAFYGLAAQQLESELGGVALYLNGASGSSHVPNTIPVSERIFRIHNAVQEAYSVAEPREVSSIESVKEEFTFHVRQFDEEKEEQAVSYYCRKRVARDPERTIEAFRKERASLAPHQGEARKSWVQVMRIGDIAVVGVPGEFFTKLGMDIKRRSPFRYTYIIELANDWIGYIPDSAAYDLGGYQVWTGNHSYLARGTGEAIVDEAVRLLNGCYRKTAHREELKGGL